MFRTASVDEPRDLDDAELVTRCVRHILGPVTFENVAVAPRTLFVVESRVDPLLRRLPARDREGLFFTRTLPADVAFIGFELGPPTSRYSIDVTPRGTRAHYTFFVSDTCLANKANHAVEDLATCTLYIVDYGGMRRPVLVTKSAVCAGMRVTYEYKIPPVPCITLPPR